MKLSKAITRRIYNLCLQKGIALNALANRAGITPSTLYSIVSLKTDVKISTLKKLCEGLDITLSEFFDDELFNDKGEEEL